MQRPLHYLMLAALSASSVCLAQTQPFIGDVQNSASYSRIIAQGSLFVVLGTNLGPAALVSAQAYPLLPQLAGTSIKVFAANSIISCPMVYTSAGQIAAILPSDTPIGQSDLTVTFNGQTSFSTTIRVAKSGFGIYSVGSSGLGPGIITGVDFITKTLAKPAKPGEVLIVWGTGLGPIAGGDNVIAAPGQTFSGVEVFVGDRAARIVNAGRSGCCAGLDQIAFEMPDVPQSCFVPVSLRTSGGASNFVSVPVSSNGAPCLNPAPGLPVDSLGRIANGEQLTIGMIGVGPLPVLQGVGFTISQTVAAQLSKLMHTPVAEADVMRLLRAYRAHDDVAARAVLAKYSKSLKAADAATKKLIRAAVSGDQQGAGAKFGRSSAFSVVTPQFSANFPAVGTCTIVQHFPADSRATAKALDAGVSLTVAGPAGSKTMTRLPNGQYQALLGTVGSEHNIAPGAYTVSGTGGKDIGAFSATLTVSSPLVWTNKSVVGAVDRTRPLTLTWSGGPASAYVWIGGASQNGDGAAVFTCVEEVRKGTFTVPSFVLSALPAAPGGTIFLAPHPFNQRITVPGLDLGFIGDASTDAKTVKFQ